ncbi:MAG: dCTP deaminase [Methanoregulaceae archaeon]|jgi:dCTP deaminase
MILSSTAIRKRLGEDSLKGDLVIRPYSEESQQPASYDLRANKDILLVRGMCTLLSSLEWVELSHDIAATLRCRSSFGRRGVLLGAGFVDPGFRGHLTLCLTNLGNADITVRQNERIVQMVFHEVKGGNQTYQGRYQDSNGVVEARQT